MTLEDCDFDQLGGNTIFVDNYNRRITVRGCLIRESGANGVAFVGSPKAVRSPAFRYGEKVDYGALDRTPGPIGEDFPADSPGSVLSSSSGLMKSITSRGLPLDRASICCSH